MEAWWPPTKQENTNSSSTHSRCSDNMRFYHPASRPQKLGRAMHKLTVLQKHDLMSGVSPKGSWELQDALRNKGHGPLSSKGGLVSAPGVCLKDSIFWLANGIHVPFWRDKTLQLGNFTNPLFSSTLNKITSKLLQDSRCRFSW